MTRTLRFVLGDQLNRAVSSLADLDPMSDVVFLCEVTEEATYVRHHKKKITFLFSAMRHFAQSLEAEGVKVDYVPLDAPGNTGRAAETPLTRTVLPHEPRPEWR